MEPLRDEAVTCATRVWQQGGEAELHVWSGAFHSFDEWVPDAIVSRCAQAVRGDWLHQLMAHARPGLELCGLIYDDAFGLPAPPVPPATRAAAVRFLAPPEGRLERISGWDRVTAHPAVLSAALTVAPGDLIGPVRGSGSRAGHLAVGADTPAAAHALARELAETITFEVTGVTAPLYR
ncbi:hypothetical protein [Streptomyces bauhiniae]